MNPTSRNRQIIITILVVVGIIGLVWFISTRGHKSRPGIINNPSVTNSPATNEPVVTTVPNVDGTIGATVLSSIPGTGIDTVFSSLETDTSAFTNMLKSGGIHVLHMPPGTSANFWHWQGDGLGILTSEITRDGAGSSKAGEAALTGRGFSFYDKYVSMLKATGDSAFPSLNISSQVASDGNRFSTASINLAINENLGLLDDLTRNGIPIVGAQLGAENYLAGGNSSEVFSSSTEFVTRVRPIAEAIRAKYPKIPLIVHPAPLEKPASYSTAWNSALVDNADMFDGVIMYAWLYPQDARCTGTSTERYVCFNNFSKNYITSQLPARFAAMSKLFPGKSIYIGQYNIHSDPVPGVSGPDFTFANSMLHGIHIADTLLAITKYNASHDNIVKTASFMNLGGASSQFHNLISGYLTNNHDSGVVTPQGSGDGQFVERAPWQAYRLVSPIFDGAHGYLGGTLAGSGAIASGDLEFYGYKGASGDEIFIFLNRGGSSVPLESLTLNGKPLLSGSFTVSDMHGSSLLSTYGAEGHSDVAFTPITLSGPESHTSASGVSIRPYSLTQIISK